MNTQQIYMKNDAYLESLPHPCQNGYQQTNISNLNFLHVYVCVFVCHGKENVPSGVIDSETQETDTEGNTVSSGKEEGQKNSSMERFNIRLCKH